jgi:tyrosine-protein kinase Etk/Wzc
MENEKNIDLLDFVVIAVKRKKILLFVGFFTAIISYTAIYLFIDEKFESNALIIPSEQEGLGGMSSLLKSVSGLPLGNLGGISKNPGIDLFNTIIYSRTNLVKLVEKFNLMDEYNPESIDKTIKTLKSDIKTNITDDFAFEISILASSPQKAADMTNFVVEELNKTIIELNIKKSKENRVFMEDRYNEIRHNLKVSEDSLKIFQKKYGVIEAEEQTRATIDAYSKFEAELATRQIELAVLQKLYGDKSPQTESARISVKEYSEKLDKMKRGETSNTFLLKIDQLSDNVMNYFRLYRDVKIYTEMLEFIIPLYEQARFDEHKDIPILQIIDFGVPPEKKSYPPRTIFTILITFSTLLFSYFLILINENKSLQESEKMKYIKSNLFNFKRKS